MNLRNATPEELIAFVAALPPWDPDLDDDPAWVRPVSQLGLKWSPAIPGLRVPEAGALPAPHLVETSSIRYCSQERVRLDALVHYLVADAPPFDPEGWFGNDHPLLVSIEDRSLRVLDGTHRIGAAIITRRSHVMAHVIRLPSRR